MALLIHYPGSEPNGMISKMQHSCGNLVSQALKLST